MLQHWCGSPPKQARNGGWGKDTVAFSTLGRPEVLDLWKRLYGAKRRIDISLVASMWSPQMLAWWFMDDGSQSSRCLNLSTDRYPQRDVEALVELFTSAGYPAKVVPTRGRFSTMFYREGSIPLAQAMYPYFLPTLRYKLDPVLAPAKDKVCCRCATPIPTPAFPDRNHSRTRFCTPRCCEAAKRERMRLSKFEK